MAITIPGFTVVTDYTELPGAKCYLQSGKLRGERKFRVLDYTRYPQFISALAGGFTFSGSSTAYNPPVLFRDDMFLWCVGATTSGIGVPGRASDGLETFSGGAEVTAAYETLPYDPRARSNDPNPTPGVYMTESVSTGGQVLSHPKKSTDGAAAWKFQSTGNDLTDDGPALVKIVPEVHYNITRHFVPTYYRSTVTSLVGSINDSAFPASSSSAGGFAAQTLLFLGAEAEQEWLADGSTKGWTVSLKFSENANGWEKLFNPNTGDYEVVVMKGFTRYIYSIASFDPLLV